MAATAVGDIQILDISDPVTPDLVAVYRPQRWADGVVLKDGLAYVALDGFGLEILDLADPSSPQSLGVTELGVGGYLQVVGSLAVLVESETLVVAPPMMTATARSITLPRTAKSRNSLSMDSSWREKIQNINRTRIFCKSPIFGVYSERAFAARYTHQKSEILPTFVKY
ncbi:MAG: hypothetical protein R6W69_03150 [Anaerolineales bacterium]